MLLLLIVFSTPWLCWCGNWTQRALIHSFVFDVGISSRNESYAVSIGPPDIDQTLKSTDLGTTWNIVAILDGVFDLACSSIEPQKAVVIDLVGDAWYTFDGGLTWNYSTSFVPGCQSISHSKPSNTTNLMLYGAAAGHGIHVSSDYGQTWTYWHIPTLPSDTARYSALPTDKIWYVSAGSFVTPSPTPESMEYDELHSFSSNYKLYQDKRSGAYEIRNVYYNALYTHSFDDGMWGQIWKTMDGGTHWNLTYSDDNRFYFNAIDCCDEQICYAVAEGNKAGGSEESGSRIFQTNDGGKHWNQTYYNDEDSSSLMAVHCLSKFEAYAAGSINLLKGTMLHTINGGITWTIHATPSPIWFMDMTNDHKYGIASGLEPVDGGAVIYAYE